MAAQCLSNREETRVFVVCAFSIGLSIFFIEVISRHGDGRRLGLITNCVLVTEDPGRKRHTE